MDAFHYGIYSLTSASVFLSLIVFIIYSRNNFNRGSLYIGISILLFALCFRFFTIHLYINHLIYNYPHFVLLNNLTSRIGLPILYFVLLSSLYSWKFKWFDALHLILPILFTIHFSNVFFGTASEKLDLIREMDAKGYEIVWQKGIFKSPYLVNAVKYLTLYGYTFLILTLLLWSGNFRRLPNHLLSFFKLAILFLSVNLIPSLISHVGVDIWEYASLIGAASTLLFTISIFFVPEFLFPLEYSKEQRNSGNSLVVVDDADHSVPVKLDQNPLYHKVEQYFRIKNPFLDPDFSLQHLEKEFSISGRYISEAIKENTGMNFSTFVNQARLDYLNENLALKGHLSDLTVDEIATELGFKSVNSFYLFLRKSKGCTPKEYLNALYDQKTYDFTP